MASFEEELRETLPPILPHWFNEGVKERFNHLPLYLRMCWFKTISGAWCAADRLSSVVNGRCVFGCTDARDSFVHYIICPVLWQFLRETLHVSEPSVEMSQWMRLCEPTTDKFKMIVFCYSLCHGVVNDPMCVNFEGHPNSAQVVQLRVLDLARHSCYLGSGG